MFVSKIFNENLTNNKQCENEIYSRSFAFLAELEAISWSFAPGAHSNKEKTRH